MSSTLAASMALRCFLSVVCGEQLLEGEHLAEHGCRLGQRERRRRHQRPVGRRQHLVHAVAELVRQRHHVARLALVVEQHVRMRRRHGRMREGARLLAGPHGCVDPVLLEEAVGDFRHCRRERAIGGEHGGARRRPTESCAAPPWAAARCGPNRAASSCRTISPSAHSSDATASDRRRARRRPAPPPPRARPGSTDGARRRRP